MVTEHKKKNLYQNSVISLNFASISSEVFTNMLSKDVYRGASIAEFSSFTSNN